MSAPVDVLLARLSRVRRSGKGWVACCPAHDDKSPSLSVKVADNGNVLLHCHAGCAYDTVLKAVGMEPKDLYPEGMSLDTKCEYQRKRTNAARGDAVLVEAMAKAVPALSGDDRGYLESVRVKAQTEAEKLARFEAAKAKALRDLGELKESLPKLPPEPLREALHEPDGDYAARSVVVERCSDIRMEPITWLWRDWLALGKLHILAGAPGTGKTTIAMSMAATVSSGGRWPDGSRCAGGSVVIWSGEDDPADTLLPRLALSGADLSRVYVIKNTVDGEGTRPFDPARDTAALFRKLSDIDDVRLLIIDPIVSAVAGDSHKSAEVRRGLQPLVDMVASLHCALVGISHFSKGTAGRDPTERVTGSLAFGALARIVMVTAKHQRAGSGDHATSILCRAKSNIGPDGGGFEYDNCVGEVAGNAGVSASYTLWGKPIDGSARDLLATADAVDDGVGDALDNAKARIVDLLANGPVSVKTIRKDADDAGIAWRTMERAKKALGIDSTKGGGGSCGAWLWCLPNTAKTTKKNSGGLGGVGFAITSRRR